MKTPIVVKMAAVMAVAGLAGCTDLKPMQAQIDNLKTQVASLQSQVAAAKSTADAANGAAASAASAANGAQSTANQALAAAQASQSCCDATNEKLDRMFKRSISKYPSLPTGKKNAAQCAAFFFVLKLAFRIERGPNPKSALHRTLREESNRPA
ncbi:MAG: alanine-zipper protein [Gammaproteobacteria bacterium]